jgi:uncharacterized membrane protein
MDRMLAVIFDDADKAREGIFVLNELDSDGRIAVYDSGVVAKNPDGTITAKQGGDYSPKGTLIGLGVGSLIGLLGGPMGVAAGFAGGTLLGALKDFENLRIGSDFVEEVAGALVPGKAALIAEIEEDGMEPVDTAMEEVLGGHVLRRSVREIKHTEDERDLATLKAEIAHAKAEHAQARADRKAKLEARIAALNAKLKQKTDQVRAEREALKRQAEARLEKLKRRAERAKEDAKVRNERWVAKAKQDYQKKLDDLNAELF